MADAVQGLAGVAVARVAAELGVDRVARADLDLAVLDADVEMVERAHRLIDTARHHAVQSSTGVRRLGETSYVHGRSGRPCRRCGGTVRVAMIGTPPQERTMFYCPACQGGLGPTDDGRAQTPLGSSSRGRAKPYRRT